MAEIPPDNSIVSIKSCHSGRYLKACSDHESVTLEKVDDPKPLPQSCLWTLHKKPIVGYPLDSLRFVSCYGRYLSTKGLVFRKLCQDNPTRSYTRSGFAGWTYDRVGTGYDDHDWLRLSLRGYYITSGKNGLLNMLLHPSFASVLPDFYWIINQVWNNDNCLIAASMPRELRYGDGIWAEDDKQRETRGGRVIVALHLSINNNPVAINTGMNANTGDGDQYVGGVKAANTQKHVDAL